MIFVDRKRVPVPKVLESNRTLVAKKKAKEFFSRPLQSRIQERFTFDASIWLECLEDLANLFDNKCAYCESHIVLGENNVDHFRPKAEALGFGGEVYSDGYWWLAYEWENLYLVCEVCNRNKRNQFPVSGRRANPGVHGRILRTERTVLIDPCEVHAEGYFQYDQEGKILGRQLPEHVPTGKYRDENRGAITIEILGLNREELVAARRQELKNLDRSWRRVAQAFSESGSELLMSMLSPRNAYLGLRRYFIEIWGIRLYKSFLPQVRGKWASALRALIPGMPSFEELDRSLAAPPPKLKKKAKRKAVPKRKRRAPFVPVPLAFGSQKMAAARPHRVKTAGYIQHISIENFKALRRVNISFPAGTERRMGWKVLLGENGAGKSSILQAVALALMGPRYVQGYLRTFRLKPADLLRKYHGKRRTKSAHIDIAFSTGKKVHVEITRNKIDFSKDPIQGVFFRGYGATRLLPRYNVQPPQVRVRVPKVVKNLFDSSQPVFNANDWLTGLKSRKHFGSAALSLKDLLHLPPRTRLRVEKNRVLVPMNGLTHSLDDLSAGYESVLVLATDIMAGVIGSVRDLRHAAGIVLLDEIDAHLHPRWKMRIVENLRDTFSSMQFLVTTHEPLCLRGLEKNEVLVLERAGKEITVLDDLPSPASMRVDQLLTSNLFGLHSTLDPEIDEKLTRYYELLGKNPSSLTSKEIRERERLRSEVAKYEPRLMAGFPGEELLYDAINEYLAKEAVFRGSIRQELPALREETRKRMADLLQRHASASGAMS